ncbi:MAG: 3D domain-containing protein [Proteobacteria bacterium]|nr:3D domain-containing protein [Pseudomonadota bacterium]
MRTLVLVLMSILFAGLWVQHSEVLVMRRQLEDQQVRLETLEGELRIKRDMGELFAKFIVSNRRKILALQRTRSLTVTAYSPRLLETDSTPYVTASNKPVRQGIVAVSRDLFDLGWVFGKKVYIKNFGIFTIDDLMAGDKRNHVDIFMFDTVAAQTFGRKVLSVSLVDL